MSIFPAVRKNPACSTLKGVLAIRSRSVAEFLGKMKLEDSIVAQRKSDVGSSNQSN